MIVLRVVESLVVIGFAVDVDLEVDFVADFEADTDWYLLVEAAALTPIRARRDRSVRACQPYHITGLGGEQTHIVPSF